MLPITEYPSLVKDVRSCLESGLSNWRQVENAMRYIIGLIVLPDRKNVSSINRSFTEYRNQASMNNFLTDSNWSDDELHRAVIQVVKDEVAKTIPTERLEPVEVYTSLLGEEHTFRAFCATVRMKHLDGTKVRLVISYREDAKEPSFYVSNVKMWEAKKILQTYALRWSIDGFHRDAKQSVGLDEYQVRKIRGVKRRIAMVFFAYVLLQLGSGFERIMGNLKANLRTTGSRCRLAGTEVLSSLVRFVVKMAHRDMDARRIVDLLMKPLQRSGYWP